MQLNGGSTNNYTVNGVEKSKNGVGEPVKSLLWSSVQEIMKTGTVGSDGGIEKLDESFTCFIQYIKAYLAAKIDSSTNLEA